MPAFGMPRYFKRDGSPCSMADWLELSQFKDYRVIAQSPVPKAFVSTVWLGVDHGFSRGKPIIFETMVFAGEDWESGGEVLDCQRYSTEAEAREGHAEMVKRYGSRKENGDA